MVVFIRGTQALVKALEKQGKVIPLNQHPRKQVADAAAPVRKITVEGKRYRVKERQKRKTPENEIKKAILEFLHLNGIFAWRQNSFAVKIEGKYFVRATEPGCPDIMGILPPNGRVLCIEVKTPRGRLTETQKKFLQRAASCGALVIVARCVEDVSKALAAEGYRLRAE